MYEVSISTMALQSLKAKVKGILWWSNSFIVFFVFCGFSKYTIFIVGELVHSDKSKLISFARYDTETPSSTKVSNQFSSCS